jgi:hypothetical protein
MESVLGQKKRNSLIRDAREFNLGWRIWMWLLSAVNLVAPLFFLGHPEAWGVLGCYFLAAAVMIPLHQRLGWVRLLGIAHFQWFVLLPWLIFRMLTDSPPTALAVWVWALILIDTVCLSIDIVDVYRYLTGERKPIVSSNR